LIGRCHSMCRAGSSSLLTDPTQEIGREQVGFRKRTGNGSGWRVRVDQKIDGGLVDYGFIAAPANATLGVVSYLKDLDYSVMQQCIHCGMCLPTCPTYMETKIEREQSARAHRG